MKYRYVLLASFLVFSSNAFAFQPKIEIFEQFDDIKMVSFISLKDINKSPKWKPGAGVPPLSVDGAIQAVKVFIKNPKASMEIKEIELRPVPRHEEHWHYLVKVANPKMKTRFDIYVVLMDKKVFPAIIEPQGYK